MKASKTTIEHHYSLAGVHLPERKLLTTRLEKISFYLNDIVLFSSVIALVASIFAISLFKNFLFGFFVFPPVVAVMFLLTGTTILFSAKYYIKELKSSIASSTLIPLFFSGMSSCLGLLSIITDFWRSLIPAMVGFNFLLLGLAAMLLHTRVTHRFHITQLLTFSVLVLNAITILGYIYQLLSYSFATPLIPIPLNIALLTSVLCYSMLLRWSNRGFFGNFTADCLSSIFALRLLVINMILMPFIGFITLALTKNEANIYIVVALLVLLLTVVAATLAWFNMKLLYKYELEHFTMREALRVHNIALTLDKKTQDVKLIELEETKKEYQDKLNHQDKLKNVLDALG